MPGATLDSIDDALFTALSTLQRSAESPTLPFVSVGRWLGPIPRPEDVTRETFGRAPAALLCCDSETIAESVETQSGDAESLGTVTWLVLIAVEDPRPAARTVKGGGSSIPGLLRLAQRVQSALNGLDIPAAPAVLTVAIAGTAGADLVVGGGRLEDANSYRWTPAVTRAAFDSAGAASINIRCNQDGSVGNLTVGDTLTWYTTPSGITGSATVTASVTVGSDGLYRSERVRCRGWRVVGVVPGMIAVAAVRFEARCLAPQADPADASVAIDRITGNVNGAADGFDSGANPLDTFRVDL